MLRTSRHFAIAVAWFWASSLLFGPVPAVAAPDDPTIDPAVVPASINPRSQPVPGRGGRSGLNSQEKANSGWWLGPVGIAAGLAVVGGLSLASKRFGWNLGMAREVGSLRVVGQTRLSPKQSVYLLQVGDRVLILGAGSAGAPTALGELTDPSEVARLIPPRTSRPDPVGSVAVAVALAGASRPNRPTTRFDQRIGDDE